MFSEDYNTWDSCGSAPAKFPQSHLVMQELPEPCIDLYYVRTIWILLRSSPRPFSSQTVFQDKSKRGRVRKCFSIEEALITTKYLSYCQLSWCQVSVVINIHYDRNSKNPSFHLVINVPIWSISSLYLSSLQQGCLLSLTLRQHTHTHTLRLTHTHFSRHAWSRKLQVQFKNWQRNTSAERLMMKLKHK